MKWMFVSVLLLAVLFFVVAMVREPDLGGGSNEIALTAQQKAAIAEDIRGMGWNCPQAKLAWAKSAEPRGDIVKLYCGPADRDGVFENLAYRVIFRPGGDVSVEPW